MGVKLGTLEISAFKVGSNDVDAIYLGSQLIYSGDTPTPPTPTFDGKWLATYTGGTTSSAECDASSAITENEITLTDLISVEIGDCVTSIGEYAFNDCGSLTSITVNATTPPALGGRAFRSTNNCPIYVPSASVSSYQSASGWSSYGSRITAIPNS